MRAVLAVVVVAACSPNEPPLPVDAGPIDAAPHNVGTCTLADPTLAAATLAGCEQFGNADGDRATARFTNPTNVAILPGGDVVVSDFDNDRLRRVTADGTTTTLVERDDFHKPFGLAVAADGTLFVETDDDDQGMHTNTSGTIWRVDPASGTATVIARDLGRPRGVVVLPDGRIALADHMHHVLSLLDPASGAVSPLAGMPDVAGHVNATGGDARFAQPYDLALLPDGTIAVADFDNHMIRSVTLAGVVTDYAGSGATGNLDGPVQLATFDAPQGLAIVGGDLYVTDVHRYFVRRIHGGAVTTVAGSGTRSWQDASDPLGASFYGLEGVDADATRLVIADGNGGDGNAFHRIRVVRLDALP